MSRVRYAVLAALVCLLCACAGAKKVGAYNPSSTDANLQPAWFIDPQNTSGCATDNPATSGTAIWGTSATCTAGNGPLLSWYGLNTQRWNCGTAGAGCPRLRQNTVLTFLSSHTTNADPVYFKPLIENGAFVLLQGATPTPVATGTTATVTAKNRATPQLLASTFTIAAPDGGAAPTLVAGELVVDTTQTSRDWIYTVGSPNKLTTPLAPINVSNPATAPAEVTTVANGDAVTIAQLVGVNLVDVSPTMTDLNQSTFNNQLIVYNLNVFDPAALDTLVVGGGGAFVQFDEVEFSKAVNVASPTPTALFAPAFVNCFFASNLSVPLVSGPQFSNVRIVGGAITGNSFAQLGATTLDGDIVINAQPKHISGNLGTVFVESARTLVVSGSVGSSSAYNSSTPVIWGPGTLNVAGTGRLGYPAGAGKAASTLTVTGLQLNGQTKYFTASTATAGGIATGNTTLSAANLDTSFGAASGCALGLGAWICNTGP